MPSLYFEKQVAALCGQHLLNNLLQGHYYEASQLSEIALNLDQQERSLGLSVDALRVDGSQNVDAGGNFSVQVLEVALENLFEIKLIRDEEVKKALQVIDNPNEPESKIEQIAFVFNFQNHWFCARWLHHQFWVLDSNQPEPKSVSRTMLTMFVSQMMSENWTVFITQGTLPKPTKQQEEDNEENFYVFGLQENKNGGDIDKKIKYFQGEGHSLKPISKELLDEDPELMEALRASLRDYDAGPDGGKLEEEPSKDEKVATTTIQLILPPNGQKVRRRFKSNLPISQIFLWAETFDALSKYPFSIQKAESNMSLNKIEEINTLGTATSLRAVILS